MGSSTVALNARLTIGPTPDTFRDKDGKTIKTKHVDSALSADSVITGLYRLGANELSVMRALDLIVSHLERGYGLDLGKARK